MYKMCTDTELRYDMGGGDGSEPENGSPPYCLIFGTRRKYTSKFSADSKNKEIVHRTSEDRPKQKVERNKGD
jgi:hypothetical protein